MEFIKSFSRVSRYCNEIVEVYEMDFNIIPTLWMRKQETQEGTLVFCPGHISKQ